MISVSGNFANVISSLFVIRLRTVLVDGMKWQQKCAFYWLLTAMCVGVYVRERDRDRKRDIFNCPTRRNQEPSFLYIFFLTNPDPDYPSSKLAS